MDCRNIGTLLYKYKNYDKIIINSKRSYGIYITNKPTLRNLIKYALNSL